MMNKEVCVILLLVMLVSLVPMVFASIEGVNISMKTAYSGGEMIKGNVQLKIVNENPMLNMSSNFMGSLPLLDWLRRASLVEGVDFRCTTKNCSATMNAKSGLVSPLAATSGLTLVGFNLSGEDIQIQSLRLGVSSTAGASCTSQLSAEVIDGNISIVNSKYISTLCDVKQTGCFSSSATTEIAEVSSNQQNPSCERLNLTSGPAYRLSAIVTNSTNVYAELTLSLYDSSWGLLDSCVLPVHKQHTEELNCIVNVSRTTAGQYMLCISAKPGVASNYTITTETSSPTCGTAQKGSTDFPRDYPLSAQPLTFASPSFEINELSVTQLTSKSLVNTLNTYLSKVYGSNCTQGCSLPIILRSATDQQVSFNIAEVKYTSRGALLTNSNLFTLENVQPTLNAERLNLSLEVANFSIPRGTKESFFVLYAGGTRVFTPVSLTIQAGFEFPIYPNVATLGLPTLFNIGGNENITQSVWKFGDGSVETIKGSALYHTYKDDGNFTLEVTATRSDGAISAKNMTVHVANANTSAKILLPYTAQRLTNLSSELAKLSSWKIQVLQRKLNISGMNAAFDALQKQYISATNDEQYVTIVKGLLGLNIPRSVAATTVNDDVLVIGVINANLRYLANISGVNVEKVSDRELVQRAIVDWTDLSYDARVKREVYSSVNDGKSTELATFFSVTITKKANNATPAFFILDAPLNSVTFDKTYSLQEVSAGSSKGVAIPISGDSTVSFALPESVELSSLGAYLAPDIKHLFSEKVEDGGWEFYSRWGLARYWLLFTLLGFFIFYIALQEWYKHHYESHLFRNADDLYNIIHFIYNARTQQLTDGDIHKKLTFSGWSGEQVTYALRKIDGKRTGMFEIPLFKFFENRKVRRELEKRQQGAVDVRFIKRPSF